MKNHRDQSGISLYTMLAAVVVLGVLGSVVVTQFDGKKSRGVALYSQMKNIAQAGQRFHLDTGCYPSQFVPLMTLSGAQSRGEYNHYSNSCSQPISQSRWKGPYISRREIVGVDKIETPAYGPNTHLMLNYFGSDDRPSVEAFGISQDIAAVVMQACGGDLGNCTRNDRGRIRLFY